jgi:hypothetical protein
MPTLRRDQLLSNLERERLENRSSCDRRIRTVNDARVRKKLAAWLMDIDDVLCILRNLPEDQIIDATKDTDINMLFHIIYDLLDTRKYYPIEGKIDNPDEWQIIINEDNKQPAKNSDIMRSVYIEGFLDDLMLLFVGENNPIAEVEFLAEMDKEPKFHDRVTDGERKSIERLNQAITEFRENVENHPSTTKNKGKNLTKDQ